MKPTERVSLDPDGSVDDAYFASVNVHFEMLDDGEAYLHVWRPSDPDGSMFDIVVEDGRLVIRERA